MGERYWEVDAVRGLALIGMIVYHWFACMVMFHMIVEDAHFLSYYNTIYIATSAFVLIAGVALILRHERVMAKGKTTRDYYLSIVRRAVQLLAIALAITVFSFIGAHLFMGSDAFIKFGFLHMLGFSMLLAIPFLRFGRWNFIPGLLIVAAGVFVIPEFTSPEWLYPLGIHGADFLDFTQDYFPLLPWFGVLLIGISLGTILYPEGKRRFRIPEPKAPGRFFAKIGHGNVTLFVYLVHIPIIFAIRWVSSAVTGYGYL
jgi:uncharacterized membrane protein